MTHHTSLPSPPGRTRGIVPLVLAILALAGAVFVVRRPLMLSAPACMTGRWHGCFDTFNGDVLLTLAALPVAALAVWFPGTS
ncbi:hypothetical protein ACPCBX_25860 [Streptomyces tuirus]|uniref:Uncharacterized protein n=1 Tax=Streptomyces tuirus TaxID=68278 RepID=A0A7G1NQ54_9ACTN|nr:hypothetical protein [Streptomyces tuirus]BCL24979.1 hypothetical protein GCM10017668_68220 [Streptomyces tuirus]